MRVWARSLLSLGRRRANVKRTSLLYRAARAVAQAHPGGRLQTTAKTELPGLSIAIGIGVSQFVNEPHTWTCTEREAGT